MAKNKTTESLEMHEQIKRVLSDQVNSVKNINKEFTSLDRKLAVIYTRMKNADKEKVSNLSGYLTALMQEEEQMLKNGKLNKKNVADMDANFKSQLKSLKVLANDAGITKHYWKEISEEINTARERIKNLALDEQAANLARNIMKDFNIDLAFSKIQALLGKIPLVGSYFSKAIGKVNREFEDTLKAKMRELGKDSVTTAESMQAVFSTAMTTLAAHPFLAIFAALALVLYGLWKIFMKVEMATREFVKNTGAVNDQLKIGRDLIISTNVGLAKYGVTLDVAAKSVAAVYNQFGGIKQTTEELVRGTALMASNLGMSEDEAAAALRQFKALGASTDKQAVAMAGVVSKMSELAGVSPKQVIADMAKNAGFLNTFFRGSKGEMAKMAVHAARLGLSLSSISTMTENLMKWDSSIEAEMNATVMLGRQINFQNARRLMWEGKISEATDEVLRQVGTLADFNKLNYMQKKAVAEAAGMEVSELTKTLSQQESLNKLSYRQRKEYDLLLESLEKRKELNGEEMLAQVRQQTELQKLSQAWDQIVALLTTALVPVLNSVILPAVEWLTTIMNGLSGTISSTTKEMSIFGSIAKGIGNYLSALRSYFEGVFETVSAFMKSKFMAVMIQQLKDAIDGLGKMWEKAEGIRSVLKGIGIVVGATLSVGITLIVATITALVKLATFIWNIFDGIANAVAWWTGSLYDALIKPWIAAYDVIKSGFSAESISNLFNSVINAILGVATTIFSAITWPFREAFKFIDQFIPGQIGKILEYLKNIPIIGPLLSGIGSIATGITASAGSMVGLADGGIVTKPTVATIGEGGKPEGVFPLGNTEIKVDNKLLADKLDMIIDVLRRGGNVYMDGKKVGERIVEATGTPGTAYPYS